MINSTFLKFSVKELSNKNKLTIKIAEQIMYKLKKNFNNTMPK